MKKNLPRKPRRQTPQIVSLQEYDELKSEILLQCELNGHFNLSIEEPPKMELLQLIMTVRTADPKLSVEEAKSKAALFWVENMIAVRSANMMNRRRAALTKLLFSQGATTIEFNRFLRRLLPRDRNPAERQRYFDEAMRRIAGTFVKLFSVGGAGWPESKHADVLKEDHSCFEPMVEMIRQRFQNGVSIDDAVIYSPIILGWREYAASVAMRGSLRHDSAVKRQGTAQTMPNKSV
jgi:hypothetical protein